MELFTGTVEIVHEWVEVEYSIHVYIIMVRV